MTIFLLIVALSGWVFYAATGFAWACYAARTRRSKDVSNPMLSFSVDFFLAPLIIWDHLRKCETK